MTTPDRFPVPVRSAVKSNLTNWCNQNLSSRALDIFVLDTQTQNGDEPVGEYSFPGQSCLSSTNSC